MTIDLTEQYRRYLDNAVPLSVPDFDPKPWRSAPLPALDDIPTKEIHAPPPNNHEVDSGLQRGGLKFDAGKPRMGLLPFDALTEVGKVLTFGAVKYAAHSWRTIPDALDRYQDALLRHIASIQSGEFTDPESGLPHWAHVACNALFCCALALSKKE